MSIQQKLLSAIKTAVKQLAPDFDPSLVGMEHPNDLTHGDYATNIAMHLGSEMKQNPRDIADELAKFLQQETNVSALVASVGVAGPGFLNIKISQQALLDEVRDILKLGKIYGSQPIGKGQKALIEYSQMNVAKPMHVGHLRTMILGDSLKRLYSFLGFETVSDTHYGDWGTQFGMVLYAYKHFGDEQAVKDDPVGELVRLYIEMSHKVKDDPDLREAAKAEFKKLEDGDEENKKLWKWFVDASVKVFDEVYSLMDILPFEYHLGESFYEAQMKEELARVLSSGIATKEDALVYVDLESEKMGRCILQKSDGATTYHLRDLATYTYRIDELKVDRNIYVVDSRQSHHFNQLFKVIELLGLKGLDGSEHVDYGFVTLPEGSLSTRKGRIVEAVEVVRQGMKKAVQVIEEKNPELKQKEEVAAEIARAAIKFANLSANRHTDIVFDWDKVLRFDGDTGPYLQYTFARIQSILRKTDEQAKVDASVELHPEEWAILRQLYRFPESVERAFQEHDPSAIAQFLLMLSHAFNAFYGALPVIQEADEAKRKSRLALIQAIAQVLETGLGLLGIRAVEEM